MNKPMTISSLFFANAFFCASLCVAQAETAATADQDRMPNQQQEASGGSSPQDSQPGDQGGPSDPEAVSARGSQNDRDVPLQEEDPLNDPDDVAGPRLRVQEQDGYLSAQITLRDEEAGFIAAVLVSTSESFMDINGESVLRGGKLVALGLGSGSIFETPLPGALSNLSEELYMQALILDEEGQLHIGPITRLSEQLQKAEQQSDA